MANSKPGILITGANGFVGSHLCGTFADLGYRVVAGVRRTANLSALDGIDVEYRYGDITQPETLPEMVSGLDYVIHNAGVVKAKSNEVFYRVNRDGTTELCEAIADENSDLKKLVLISSLATMGPSRDDAITEDTPQRPVTVYGDSKKAGEEAMLKFRDRIPMVILRPAGVYGPGDIEVFPFFRSAHRGFRVVIGDPSRRIQMVHVSDVCRAAVAAVEKPTVSGEAYLIAERRTYTMQELVDTIVEASGKKARSLRLPGVIMRFVAFFSEFGTRAFGGAPMLTRDKCDELLGSWPVNTDKAKRDLGFESSISFEQGARETFAWYREQGWLK